MTHLNQGVPNSSTYYPLSTPAIGTAFTDTDKYPQNVEIPLLFQPLKIRDVTFKNRIWVSPMCQYSASKGLASDWHLVHLGGFATRGAGSIMVEATAVEPEGRISPEDLGIWSDDHIAPLKRIVEFVHSQGTKIGIQLAHAGRKASTYAPWVAANPQGKQITPSHTVGADEDGWPDNVWSASDIPFDPAYPTPKSATLEKIEKVKQAFVDAVKRAKTIGFDFVEIHGAHGYFIHQFYSPLSNKRTDNYGGSFENRIRLFLEIASLVRQEWGNEKPVFARLSATDWAQQGLGEDEASSDGVWNWWGPKQTELLTAELIKAGVDLVDVSTGGNYNRQKIPVGPHYQVPFARALKQKYPNLFIGSVGLITDPQAAEQLLQEGDADVIFLARELLRRVDWPLIAAQELGVAVKPANQYERAWTRLLQPGKTVIKSNP